MVDVFNVVLAVVTLLSVVFVGITEGLKQTTGYRGCEETRSRKERIDKKLYEEMNREIATSIGGEEWNKKPSIQVKTVGDLGYRAYVAENLSNDILEGTDRFVKKAFRNLLIATVLLFITVLVITNATFTTNQDFVLLIYLVLPALVFYNVVKATGNSIRLRTELIKLDEKSTLDYAVDLYEELVDKELI